MRATATASYAIGQEYRPRPIFHQDKLATKSNGLPLRLVPPTDVV